jgi:prepilin-type N-terminal cleavage/methylation domain-containing protein
MIRLPRNKRNAAAPGRRGFTLTELAVVVLIISIFTAVAVPKFVDSLIFYRIESAARRVKADLELTRQTAKLTSASQSITFDGASYEASSGVTSLDSPGQPYVVNLAAEPYRITNVTANIEGQTVEFDGFGKPAVGGTIVLTAPNHECAVEIDEETGEITISRNHVDGNFTE